MTEKNNAPMEVDYSMYEKDLQIAHIEENPEHKKEALEIENDADLVPVKVGRCAKMRTTLLIALLKCVISVIVSLSLNSTWKMCYGGEYGDWKFEDYSCTVTDIYPTHHLPEDTSIHKLEKYCRSNCGDGSYVHTTIEDGYVSSCTAYSPSWCLCQQWYEFVPPWLFLMTSPIIYQVIAWYFWDDFDPQGNQFKLIIVWCNSGWKYSEFPWADCFRPKHCLLAGLEVAACIYSGLLFKAVPIYCDGSKDTDAVTTALLYSMIQVMITEYTKINVYEAFQQFNNRHLKGVVMAFLRLDIFILALFLLTFQGATFWISVVTVFPFFIWK